MLSPENLEFAAMARLGTAGLPVNLSCRRVGGGHVVVGVHIKQHNSTDSVRTRAGRMSRVQAWGACLQPDDTANRTARTHPVTVTVALTHAHSSLLAE